MASLISGFSGADPLITTGTEGYVLVDVKLLCAYLDTVSKCKDCNNTLETKPLHAKRQGFAMSFVGYCHICDNETVLFHSSNV